MECPARSVRPGNVGSLPVAKSCKAPESLKQTSAECSSKIMKCIIFITGWEIEYFVRKRWSKGSSRRYAKGESHTIWATENRRGEIRTSGIRLWRHHMTQEATSECLQWPCRRYPTSSTAGVERLDTFRRPLPHRSPWLCTYTTAVRQRVRRTTFERAALGKTCSRLAFFILASHYGRPQFTLLSHPTVTLGTDLLRAPVMRFRDLDFQSRSRLSRQFRPIACQ